MSLVVRDKGVSTRTRRRISGLATVPASRTAQRTIGLTRQPAALLETLAGRLTPHEWRRRMMHILPGLMPVLFLMIPHADPLAIYAQIAFFTILGWTSQFALRHEALFRRNGERGWATSVLSYGIITLGLLLALPGQPEIGMSVMMIIAFGDGSATLVGLLLRGRRLPWNRDKSWVGLADFLVCATPLATLIYWAEARPGVALSLACTCVAPAVLTAALAESLPVRINDNVRVGVTAGLTLLATQALFVGW